MPGDDKDPNKDNPFLALPPDVRRSVYTFLENKELVAVAKTSKKLREEMAGPLEFAKKLQKLKDLGQQIEKQLEAARLCLAGVQKADAAPRLGALFERGAKQNVARNDQVLKEIRAALSELKKSKASSPALPAQVETLRKLLEKAETDCEKVEELHRSILQRVNA